MNKDEIEGLFRVYIHGWKADDKRLILSACDASCEITECYGPKHEESNRFKTRLMIGVISIVM